MGPIPTILSTTCNQATKIRVHVVSYRHMHYLQPSNKNRSLCRSTFWNVCTAGHAEQESPSLSSYQVAATTQEYQCKSSVSPCICFVLSRCQVAATTPDDQCKYSTALCSFSAETWHNNRDGLSCSIQRVYSTTYQASQPDNNGRLFLEVTDNLAHKNLRYFGWMVRQLNCALHLLCLVKRLTGCV